MKRALALIAVVSLMWTLVRAGEASAPAPMLPSLSDEQLIEFELILNRTFGGPVPTIEEARKWILDSSGEVRRRRVEGLRQSINDSLIMAVGGYLRPGQESTMNKELSRAKLPPFRDLLDAWRKSYRAVLARGAIASDEEYYVLRGLVSNLASELTATERAQADAILGDFENRAGDKK